MSAMNEFRRVLTGSAPAAPPVGKEVVLRYLADGAPLAAARSYGRDERDPSRRRAFPLVTYTDGSWVWDASVAYYLREYDAWPEPDFVRTVADAGGQAPEVPADRVQDAVQFLRGA